MLIIMATRHTGQGGGIDGLVTLLLSFSGVSFWVEETLAQCRRKNIVATAYLPGGALLKKKNIKNEFEAERISGLG